jgi:hypothetical protein
MKFGTLWFATICGVLNLLLISGVAHAATVTYSSAASWNSAVTVTGGDNYDSYNWSAGPPGGGTTLLADFSSTTLSGINYSLTQGEIYGISPAYTNDAAYLTSNYLLWQNSGVPLTITLPTSVTAIGFNYGSDVGNAAPFVITLGNGFSITVNSNSNSYAFFGVSSDTAFSSFTIGDWPQVGALDNLAYSATPLPAALPLFATGLGAMGLLGWWRKRTRGK